jgi:hypothetical protein
MLPPLRPRATRCESLQPPKVIFRRSLVRFSCPTIIDYETLLPSAVENWDLIQPRAALVKGDIGSELAHFLTPNPC